MTRPERWLVSYADRHFRRAQKVNAWTALRHGGLDRLALCGPADLRPGFAAANRAVLSSRRGAGLWLWKPHVILETLRRVPPGSLVAYCDSGAEFTGPVAPLEEACRSQPSGVLGFDLGALRQGHWTKRDAFVLLGQDQPGDHDAPQMMASFILFVASERAIAFAEKWLACAEDFRLLGDGPSQCGLPELPGFREHRHDQSIFSLLCRAEGVASGNDIAPGQLDRTIRLTRRDAPWLRAASASALLALRGNPGRPGPAQPPTATRRL